MESTEIQQSIEELTQILERETPILLLGAGFSCGAHNKFGLVPLSKDLKPILLDKFYKGASDYKELEQMKLLDLCTNIVADGNQEELQNFLTQIFKNTVPTQTHLDFVQYPWSKIYTLNIDDLVENIYKANNKKLIVTRKEQEQISCDGAMLIKLHGDVNTPEVPYVFCENSYINNHLVGNYAVSSFANDFYNYNTIFLGTEFDEIDLLTELFDRELTGYHDYYLHFFITPTINDRKIRKKIEKKQNYIHIPWTTSEFIDFAKTISLKNTKIKEYEQKLRHAGFIAVHKESDIKQKNTKIYSGATVTYQDIYDDYDIKFYKNDKIFEEVLDNKTNSVICIHGKAYIGKSTYAKRLLYEFYKKGYSSFELKINNILDFEILSEYLRQLPKKTKLAILFEEAAMYYKPILDLLESKFDNINKIVVIAVSRSSMHFSKCYEIQNYYNYYPIELDYTINEVRAKLIYSKLEENFRMGELTAIRKKGEGQKARIAMIMKQKNLIDCLYFITHGTGYASFFSQSYDKVIQDIAIKSLLYDIILFSVMGIESYPALYIRKFHHQITDQKIALLDETLDVYSNGDVKIRAAEFFKAKIVASSDKEKVNTIRKYLKVLKGSVDEQILNNDTRIFECLLHFNTLRQELKINLQKNELETLFCELEADYRNISYYWLQRALFKQAQHDYDNAYMFLFQARDIHPDSYKINHAYAQNYLDQALEQLQRDPENSFALQNYQKGMELMQGLIVDEKYSGSRAHAIHTFIDRSLKFSELMNKPLSQDEYDSFCALLLKVLPKNENDAVLFSLKRRLLSYASENSLIKRM